MRRDLSGGPLVENLPCSAGYVSPVPGAGTKISHAAGQLSPCATATEPELQSPGAATAEPASPSS